MAALGAISFLAVPAIFAEDTAPAKEEAAASPPVVVDGVVSTAPAPAAAPAQTPVAKETTSTPKLPYGVEDVLKLSRAQVSEDVTLSFIQSSGTIYDLRPNDIVYLKEQGVSAKVINAMIDQRKKAMDVAAQTAAVAASQAAAAAADASSPALAAPLTPFAPSYVEAPPAYTYVEPAPDYVPDSTLYVIPYPAAAYAYYNYSQPYYGYGGSRYYGAGYCAPSTVYRFGCGNRGYGSRGYGRSYYHR